jgi:hypothetical protein
MRSARAIAVPAVLGVTVTAALGIGSAAAPATAELSGKEIVARMARAYAHCTSYQDTGVVTLVYLESGRKRIEERPFKTAFV